MDEDLKEILTNYRACTLQIIEIIQNDKLDSLQKLIDDRQKLVDEVLNMACEKEEMEKVYKQLNLDELQSELNSLMSGKLSFIRNEMEKIAKSKIASNGYNQINNNSAKIFSKKI